MTNNEYIYFLSRNKQTINHNSNLLRPLMSFYPTQNIMINKSEISAYFNKPYISQNTYTKFSETNQVNHMMYNIIQESQSQENSNNYKSNNKSNFNRNNSNYFQQRNISNFENEIEEVPKIKFPDVVNENSTEADKWLAARKRNFPYLEKKTIVEEKNQEHFEKGLISKLELKLREKIKIMNRIGKRVKKKQEKKEYETLKKEMNTKFRNDQKTKVLKENAKETKVLSKRAKRRLRNKMKDSNLHDESKINEIQETNVNISSSNMIEKSKGENHENFTTSSKPLFAYHKNTILKDIFKDEFNKELGIILQSLFYFEKEGLLDE